MPIRGANPLLASAGMTRGRRGCGVAVGVLAAGVVLAATMTGCSGNSGAGATGASTAVDDTTPRAGCLPAGETRDSTSGPYGIGRSEITFGDTSRPTAASPRRGLPPHPDRTLPTVILYPTDAHPTDATIADAPAAAGQFPLVVVSHGVMSNGATFSAIVAPWVRAGYVVAAPTFPLSSGSGADITDLANQPGDVRFVTESVLALADPSQPVQGHIAADCLALAGHSMGAATTLEATYESSYLVPRVDAAIEISGVMAAMPGGTFDDAPAVPLLLLHGDDDPVVAVSGSQHAFEQLPGPNYFVTFRRADHNSLFTPPYKSVLDQAAITFLDAELKGAEPPRALLAALLDGSTVATLQVKDATH